MCPPCRRASENTRARLAQRRLYEPGTCIGFFVYICIQYLAPHWLPAVPSPLPHPGSASLAQPRPLVNAKSFPGSRAAAVAVHGVCGGLPAVLSPPTTTGINMNSAKESPHQPQPPAALTCCLVHRWKIHCWCSPHHQREPEGGCEAPSSCNVSQLEVVAACLNPLLFLTISLCFYISSLHHTDP